MQSSFKILDAYAPMFYSDKSYYLISGGRASGKSTQVSAYFILKLFGNDYFRGVISRYSAKSVKFSIYQDILDLIESWGLKSKISIRGEEIINKENGNKILTHSFKIPDGTMQAKGKGISKPTHLIIDEAQELPSEEEYIKVIDSFRVKGVERKIFVVFNPGSKLHWIHQRWFIDGSPNPIWNIDHEFIHTTYKDNIDNIDPSKIEEWERMKDQDPEYYDHHIMGKWREAYEGKIYSGWNFEYDPPEDAETFYGLDFGFSSDPTAVVEVKKKDNSIWLREILYNTGLTNEEIASILLSKGLNERSQIIADSSEPKSIEELKRAGLKRISGAIKGPGSIITGIKRLSGMEVYCDPHSKNLINEYNSYCWKVNKDIPEDKNNHILDAVRYALTSIRSKEQVETFSYNSYKKRKQYNLEKEMYG